MNTERYYVIYIKAALGQDVEQLTGNREVAGSSVEVSLSKTPNPNCSGV